ncbi:MAG: M6 family metalloprotease domain-containing protein [Bacteroidales bacterium]|jgi:M6 family metalloprotease-like protein|nr:M6 family metalloprotease domain-containing protein [Bacteroidales bacterium]
MNLLFKNQKSKRFFLWVVVLVFAVSNASAAYLKDIPYSVVQPNGDTLHCFVSGDEFFNYLHDKEGFTIIKNSDGYYTYAIYDGDNIVPSQFVAGTVNPLDVGLQPNVTISNEEYQARRAAWFNFEDIPRLRTPGRNHGTLNNLVVFIRFADEENITTPFSNIENMFNNQTSGYNSMINYFQTTSYGHLNIPSTFFPVPDGNLILSYQDDNPRSYFQPYSEDNPDGYQGGNNGWERTQREHKLLRKAIEFIADMVPADLDLDYNNDGYVDNVCFIVKGNNDAWATLLWPHRWALYNEYATIHGKRVWDYNFQLEGGYFNTAVLCHEMQHTLGFPDLYHYANGGPTPVGNWDIMESNPNPPQQSGGYMKWKYGNWLFEPTEIEEGIYTLNSIGSGLGLVSYKIPTSDPQQFFVLEYRNSNDNFENFNYGNVAGMLIYRINTNFGGNADYNPNDEVFDEVYIFRPDGNSPTQNGEISIAHFGPDERTTFDENSNPKPFFTDGAFISDLAITEITVTGKKLSFIYNGGTTQYVSVVFHPNGGNGLMTPQLFASDVEQNLKANSFTLEGYVFDGWALTPDGEVVYEDNQPVEINDDIALYAVWSLEPPQPVYYTITAAVRQPVKNWPLSIEPEGEILVLEHTIQTFVIQAGNYPYAPLIEAIEVDGIIYYPQNDEEYYRMEYTFEDVTENHYIIAISDASGGINDNSKTCCLFSIQPNPATQYVEIILPVSEVTAKGVTAQIYDVQGLLLKTIMLYEEKTQIDISNLVKGFYIVKIGKEAKKLVVR